MKRSNPFLRAAAMLLALALATTSFSFGRAKYIEKVADGAVFYFTHAGAPQEYTAGSAQAFTPAKGWWGFVLRGGQGGKWYQGATRPTTDNGDGGAAGNILGMCEFDGSTTIYIWVAAGGSSGTAAPSNTNSASYGGGPPGSTVYDTYYAAGGGGGASIIATGGTPSQSNIIAIAAGGGGGSRGRNSGSNMSTDSHGGDGGSILTPNDGAVTYGLGWTGGITSVQQTARLGWAGGGGGATGGGVSGDPPYNATAQGSALQGGTRATAVGGGGGGWYGGGAGMEPTWGGGGGGGSSYTNAAVYALPTAGAYSDVRNYLSGFTSTARHTTHVASTNGYVCLVYMGLHPVDGAAFY